MHRCSCDSAFERKTISFTNDLQYGENDNTVIEEDDFFLFFSSLPSGVDVILNVSFQVITAVGRNQCFCLNSCSTVSVTQRFAPSAGVNFGSKIIMKAKENVIILLKIRL